MKRGHRRPRKRSGRAPTSSIDRSIAHASTNQLVVSGLELGAGALAPFATGELIEQKQWLHATIKDADWRRYTIAGTLFVGGLLLHPYASSLGMGLVVGSTVYAFAPPLKKALTAALAPAAAPQQLPAPAPAPVPAAA